MWNIPYTFVKYTTIHYHKTLPFKSLGSVKFLWKEINSKDAVNLIKSHCKDDMLQNVKCFYLKIPKKKKT